MRNDGERHVHSHEAVRLGLGGATGQPAAGERGGAAAHCARMVHLSQRTRRHTQSSLQSRTSILMKKLARGMAHWHGV